MMKKIKLTQGKYAEVDDEDFEWLSQWKWYARNNKNTWYAVRNICKNGKRKILYMHRVIMNCPKNKQIDHINHNGLDNRKINLRICTQSKNVMNSRKQKNTSSRYKGVNYHFILNKWRSTIQINRKYKHLGYYKDEIISAKIYDYKAKELFGEYSYLNFPNEPLTEKQFNKLYSNKVKTSEYVGVSKIKNNDMWKASIRINYKQKHIGVYNIEENAAKARDKYIIDNNLDLKKYKLNFKKG